MPTLTRSDLLRSLYQSWSDRMAANTALTIADVRSLLNDWHQPALEPEGVTCKSDLLAGVESGGMQHVFPFLAGRAREADDELRRIAKWFKGA